MSKIEFKAGGLVSILLQPDFLYNYLHVDIDGHIMKRMFDTQNYPEIDSQLYSFFVEGGRYLRFDYNFVPGNHFLWLKGDGDVEYKIVTNYDWDDDDLGDVDEFQLADDHNVDPGVADLWGYFQKSEESILWSETEGFEFKEGHFDFYVPNGGTHFLTFEIYNGNFTHLDVDGDLLSFQDIWLSADHPKTSMTIYKYQFFDEGWHYVEYDYLAGLSKISFRVDNVIVKNIKSPTLLDSDGDGIKDLEEQSQYHDVNKLDSDDDGLPDAYDSSPSSSLMLDNAGMLQVIFDAEPSKNSIVTMNIQKPLHDYSTQGIPILWRNMYNVSISPVLRLFGNQYTEDVDIGPKDFDRAKLYEMWGKNIETISTLDRNYNIYKIGDPLPSSQPDNELWFIFPRPAEKTIEFEFTFPRFHDAKLDNALDLRFDFIWLVTYYNSTDGSTNILHYYDFEDDILIQSLVLKEMGDVNYKIASPENFIENQIIWAITQNPELEIPQSIDIQDRIIGEGNLPYNLLNDEIITDLSDYYDTSPPKGNEVVYLASLQDNYDILQKLVISNGQEEDESKFTQGDYQAYNSFYTISNVYETEEYNFGDPQIKGEQKVVYQNTFTGFSTILGMPLAIDFNSYSDSDVLTITEAISEPIPSSRIPTSLDQQMHDKIILHHETYIEKRESTVGTIPLLNFNPETDIYKEFVDTRARQVDQGELFFEDFFQYPSRGDAFESQMDQYRGIIEEMHNELSYYTTQNGQYYYPGEEFEPLREYSTFLDTFRDDNGEYLIGFLSEDPNTKLNKLNELERKLPKMVERVNEYQRYEIVPEEEDPMRDWQASVKLVKKLNKKIKDVHNVAKYRMSLSKMYGSGAYNLLYEADAITKFKPTLKQKISLGAKRFGNSMKTVIGISVLVVLGAIAFTAALADLGRLIAKAQTGAYDHNIAEFYSRFAIGLCELTIGAVTTLNGVLRSLKQYTEIAKNTLPKAIKFLGKVVVVMAIVIEIFQWAIFISKAVTGELSESEFWYEFTKMTIQSAALLIGLGIAASISSTGIGIVVGVVIAALSILTSWLTPLFNHPSLKLHKTKVSFPAATSKNIRRHGSLEVNDEVSFYLKVQNNGDRPGWVRARFRVQEASSSGWTGNDYWTGKGNWGDNVWPWNLWGSGNYLEHTFTSQITGPSTNLHFKFDLQFDWEKFEIIIIWPVWSRQTGARETVVDEFNMPVLQNTISAFYGDTQKLVTTELLKDEFDRAVEEYQYKDAFNIANQIIAAAEAVAETDSTEIVEIIENMEELDASHSFYHFSDPFKFADFIDRFYEEGVRARDVIPDIIWFWIRSLGDKIRHLWSFIFANGDVTFPKTWIESKEAELGDAGTYTILRNELPLKTNIRVDLREEMIDIDPYTKTAEVNVPLHLRGPDGNEIVNIEIIAPDGFSITPNIINQKLKQDISFTVTQLNHSLIMNVFFFDLIIRYNGKLVYDASVPFRLKPFSLLTFEENVPTEPITPGEYYSFFTIEQLGTIPDTVEFLVDGIPEEFIYKDLSPDAVFSIYPGESRPLLVINAPKHYATVPDIYNFNITARDPIYNKTHYTYEGSFEVEVFHDLSFNCTVHDIAIYDYQTAVYECEIMNLGNVIEEFEVTFTDVDFVDSSITSDEFILEPGEYATFNITLDPFDLGYHPFTITVASDFVSENIVGSLNVTDDDILDPWFENLFITDNCNWLNISFLGLDLLQGDDMGLSLIEIYVDGELIHSYIPSPSETTFNFDLANDWIWEVLEEYYTNGFMNHSIRIRIVDADDDRTDDELIAEVLDTFSVTLDEMYNYVIWLCGDMNNYIYDNSISALFGVFTQKLVKIQNLLLDAYQLIQNGYLHTGLVRNKMAEIKLEIADTKMELMASKQSMSPVHFEYLKDGVQNIRNKIVELMGLSVGTELGHKLSLQEVELYNLGDVIEENINESDSENLVNVISLTNSKLEKAIFDISLGKSTEASIIQAIQALSHANAEIISLANKGKITEGLKNSLLASILLIQAQLILIMNNLI